MNVGQLTVKTDKYVVGHFKELNLMMVDPNKNYSIAFDIKNVMMSRNRDPM